MSIANGVYGSYSGDYYSRGLGHLLRAYRLPDLDYALTRDPDVYDRMRRDPVLSFPLRFRKLLAAGTDWYLEPASDSKEDRQVLDIMEDLIKNIESFDVARFNLAEAIIAGSRWAKIEGEDRILSVGGDKEKKSWTVIANLADVDKRRFRQFPIDSPPVQRDVQYLGAAGQNVTLSLPEVRREWIWQIYRPLQQTWEEVDRDDYIKLTYDDREDTLGYGGGLASELYTYWFAKEVGLQHGLQYLERWSQGILVASVESLRDGQASAPTSAQRMTDWLNALNKMRSRHVLVHDSKDEIKVHDAPTTGWLAAKEMIEYLDGAMVVAILGSSLPTKAGVEGGSFALAEVQQKTTEILSRFDHACLEGALRRDLVRWLFDRNYANFQALGLECCTLPYVRIRSSHGDDNSVRADVLLKARQAGLEIRKDEAYAQLGFSLPSEHDETLPPLLSAAGGSPNGLGNISPVGQGKTDGGGQERGAGGKFGGKKAGGTEAKPDKVDAMAEDILTFTSDSTASIAPGIEN